MVDTSKEFEIRFLDHVAIRVKDLKVAADWYQNVLGLKKYQLPEWGDYPIFMLAKKSGVALFPANTSDRKYLLGRGRPLIFWPA
ncbi:MAG: VOC family protein [Maribacter sp.]|nr:VOC family protein [Maribacter sp.]